jgi:hypothetical protein
LKRARYGPDILMCIPDSSLTDIGIPHGDVIRLKDGSSTWYNSPAAKQAGVGSNRTQTAGAGAYSPDVIE